MRLTDLSPGACATVASLRLDVGDGHEGMQQRLQEIGFIPGEPVQLLRRGPGGREPLAVLIGESMFALRWVEAHCVEVQTL